MPFIHMLMHSLVGDEWEDGRLHSSPNLSKFIPPTHNWCHYL